jgi:hypothetical protein
MLEDRVCAHHCAVACALLYIAKPAEQEAMAPHAHCILLGGVGNPYTCHTLWCMLPSLAKLGQRQHTQVGVINCSVPALCSAA